MSLTDYQINRLEQFPNLGVDGREVDAETLARRTMSPERVAGIHELVELALAFAHRIPPGACNCDVDFTCERCVRIPGLAIRAARLLPRWRRVAK